MVAQNWTLAWSPKLEHTARFQSEHSLSLRTFAILSLNIRFLSEYSLSQLSLNILFLCEYSLLSLNISTNSLVLMDECMRAEKENI
jgi:hypothetical protein